MITLTSTYSSLVFIVQCKYNLFSALLRRWEFYSKVWNDILFFIRGVEMYCTVLLWDVFFFSHSDVCWANRVFYFRQCWSKLRLFYGLFYYVCSLCTLLCFPLPQLAQVFSVRTGTSWTTRTERHHKFSPLLSELRLITSFESIALHPPHTKPQSLRGTNRHQFWL